ncbi:Uncharacterised protein [Bordetella pertussis]|nr:Uncharacterised protein [Bordetella pertussis]
MFSAGQWRETPLYVREDLARPPGASARAGARAAPRHRHAGRPGHARGLQQSVHVDRRADGVPAAEHRLLGQHQGAPGLLLRHLRRRGQPDRQRAAHAGAPGLDGRIDQDGDARQCVAHAAGRRLCGQRSVPRRHAPARCDRHHAGVRPRRPGHPVLCRLARPPCRHRRNDAGLDAAGLPDGGRRRRAVHQFPAGRQRRVPRPRGARDPGLGALAGAQSGPEHRRPARADRRQREGRAGAAAHVRPLRPGRGAGLHGARAGQRRGGGAARDFGAEGRALYLSAGQRRGHRGGRARRPPGAQRGRRFHRHLGPAGEQLQCAGRDRGGGGAVRVPDPGR